MSVHEEWQGNQPCFPDVKGKEGNGENRMDKRECDATNQPSSTTRVLLLPVSVCLVVGGWVGVGVGGGRGSAVTFIDTQTT